MKYGKQYTTWSELSENLVYENNKPYTFDYTLNLKEQVVKLEVSFKTRKDIPDENHQTSTDSEGNRFEKVDNDNFVIPVQAEFDIHKLLMLNGEFTDPFKIDDAELRESLSGEETKGNPFHCDFPPLSMSLKESKPDNAKKIRFRINGRFKKKQFVVIKVYEMVGNNRKFIYETEPTSIDKIRNEYHYFAPIEINTD